MPSKICICFPQYIHFLNGRRIYIGRKCFCVPLYVEVDRVPPIPPWKEIDPRRLILEDLVREFDGATVGPNLRDLATTLSALQSIDTIQNVEVRARLQEVLGETVRELASASIPDAEVELEFDREEVFRAEKE